LGTILGQGKLKLRFYGKIGCIPHRGTHLEKNKWVMNHFYWLVKTKWLTIHVVIG